MSNGDGNSRDAKILQDILIHVGKTSEGITNLKEDVREVKDHLAQLNNSAVRKDECTQRHLVVATSIDNIRKEVKGDLSEIKHDLKFVRSQTRDDNMAITAEMLAAGPEVEEEEDTGKGLKYWLSVAGGIITVLGFLGAVVWGVFKVGRYMERVDQGLTATAKTQTQTLAKVTKPRYIYITVPPDAGIKKTGPPSPSTP